MPGKVIDVPLLQKGNRFELDVEGIKKHLNGKDIPKIIYLCTPNNPTANLLKQEDVEAVCDAAKNKSVIVVDETYLEFSGHESMIKHMQDNPNIIVLRTLSKSFALAGQRMGCLISSDEKFIQLVRSKGMEIYPLPRGSVEAALKILQPDMLKLAEKNREILIAERKRLEKNFTGNSLVLQMYDSDANFLLVRMKRAREFTAHCTKNKIILRDFSDKPHTEDCLRITVGTPEQNDKLMSLLKNFSEQ